MEKKQGQTCKWPSLLVQALHQQRKRKQWRRSLQRRQKKIEKMEKLSRHASLLLNLYLLNVWSSILRGFCEPIIYAFVHLSCWEAFLDLSCMLEVEVNLRLNLHMHGCNMWHLFAYVSIFPHVGLYCTCHVIQTVTLKLPIEGTCYQIFDKLTKHIRCKTFHCIDQHSFRPN